jgi:hypothetical protein
MSIFSKGMGFGFLMGGQAAAPKLPCDEATLKGKCPLPQRFVLRDIHRGQMKVYGLYPSASIRKENSKSTGTPNPTR